MKIDLLNSNALHVPLADSSVHCVVTSPPYYGLRDYSVSGQLGLEPTLQEYIDNTVKWCAEVWRVLRDDGTFWLNLGDSYNGSGGDHKKHHKNDAGFQGALFRGVQAKSLASFKPKDLMLVPARISIALQEWGWWVRRDIIWHKPNPMPESVTDRPTTSHEYIFLLTKNKKYYYDADAIREPIKQNSIERLGRAVSNKHKNLSEKAVPPGQQPHGMHKARAHGQYKRIEGKAPTAFEGCDHLVAPFDAEKGRNKRSVWTITTKPYKGAHFATFPPEIPEICIKAGTSEKGVCPVCGNQRERIIEVSGGTIGESWHDHSNELGRGHRGGDEGNKAAALYKTYKREFKGWKSTCSHDVESVPATVLDPFGGSGTTAMVANQLGRHGISLDLSWEYLQLAKKRTGITGLQEWENGRKAEVNLEGLPMFEEVLSD